MRVLLAIITISILTASAGQVQAQGLKYQRGYTKKDGTYVDGHYKTKADGKQWNNRKEMYGY